MQYAIIENNIIVNVAEADAPLADNWEPLQADASIGWTRTGAGQPFEAPAVESVAQDTRITRLAFRNRFTKAEKVMLELAALDDPAAPMAQRQQSAAIRVYLADVAASSFIDLADPGTRAGVQALEAGGLLAAGRATVILNAPVTPSERLSTT